MNIELNTRISKNPKIQRNKELNNRDSKFQNLNGTKRLDY